MGDIGGAFGKKKAQKGSDSAAAIVSFEESFLKTLRRYKEDIEELAQMLQGIREERIAFYSKRLPEIRQEMEMDEVSPEIRAEWLRNVQDNMEKSFQISEQLIEHYITNNLNEFETALKETLRQGRLE